MHRKREKFRIILGEESGESTTKGEGGVVSIFTHKLLNRECPVIFGDGQQTRDFIYVKDVATANFLSLEKGESEIINIGRNEKVSINELYSQLVSIIPTSIPPIYLAKRIGDIPQSRLDHTKAKHLLRWEPVYDLKSGLIETFHYYLSTT